MSATPGDGPALREHRASPFANRLRPVGYAWTNSQETENDLALTALLLVAADPVVVAALRRAAPPPAAAKAGG